MRRSPTVSIRFLSLFAGTAVIATTAGCGDDSGQDADTGSATGSASGTGPTGGGDDGDDGSDGDGSDASTTGGGSTATTSDTTSGDDGSTSTGGVTTTSGGTTTGSGSATGSTSGGTTTGGSGSTGGTTTSTTGEDPASCDSLGEACCSSNTCYGGLECAGGVCSCVRSIADGIVVDADGGAWSGLNRIRYENDTVVSNFLNTGAAEGINATRQLACGLHDDGTVSCWFNVITTNDKGQLGNGTFNAPAMARRIGTPVQVLGGGTLTDVTGIAIADTMGGCAVDQAEAVWCWGAGTNGRLGDNGEMNRNAAVRVEGEGGSGFLAAIMVKVQRDTTCALDSGGQLWCWGSNDFTKMGVGATPSKTDTPIQAMNGLPSTIVDFDLSSDNIYVLLQNGEIWAAGSNGSGELGNGQSGATASVPEPVLEAGSSPVTDFTDLRAWYRGVYAVRGSQGDLYQWGGNNFGMSPTRVSAFNNPFSLPTSTWSPMGMEFDYVDVDGDVKRLSSGNFPSTIHDCQ